MALDALYRIARVPLFRLEAESAHELATGALAASLATPLQRALARRLFGVDDPALRVNRWGIDFPNPVGLAAGFDKAGTLFNALGALGFGFVEIGTVTAHGQVGNPRPRLFRLPDDEALVNRMGFNNPGAEVVARRLARGPIEPVLGINIGKSKVTPLEDAASDYLRSVDLLLPHARYLVVNVSSPNTPGLRSLQEAEPLRELLHAIVERVAGRVPVLVKLAPDLAPEQVEEAVGIALAERVAGIVATNTTTARSGLRTPSVRVPNMGQGGLSGRPLRGRAREFVAHVHRLTGGKVPIIGVGGIFDADDAWQMLRAGASLLQLYTGFIYRGPTAAHDISRGLLERMRRDGVKSVDEVVGTDSR